MFVFAKTKRRANTMSGERPLLVTDRKAAELLGIGRTKVWDMVRAGVLTPVKLPPKSTRFSVREIEELANPKK
jgi:predicted DNA-binding transcriptional regulator AlpA